MTSPSQASLLFQNGTENSLVSLLTRHKGPVCGMEFNTLSPNHLASGAGDGDICILRYCETGRTYAFSSAEGPLPPDAATATIGSTAMEFTAMLPELPAEKTKATATAGSTVMEFMAMLPELPAKRTKG